MPEPESESDSEARLVVTCPKCETRTALTHPNEAVETFERHRGVTGHAMVWERADLGVETPVGDVARVLEELAEACDAAVPIGSVTAAMSEQGVTIAETLDELYELRMTGRLYEPRDDHVATV